MVEATGPDITAAFVSTTSETSPEPKDQQRVPEPWNALNHAKNRTEQQRKNTSDEIMQSGGFFVFVVVSPRHKYRSVAEASQESQKGSRFPQSLWVEFLFSPSCPYREIQLSVFSAIGKARLGPPHSPPERLSFQSVYPKAPERKRDSPLLATTCVCVL